MGIPLIELSICRLEASLKVVSIVALVSKPLSDSTLKDFRLKLQRVHNNIELFFGPKSMTYAAVK